MLPECFGHIILTCFPSIAPIQFGKFHRLKYSSLMFSNISVDGTGMCSGCKTFHSTPTVSFTILLTVDAPIRNVKDKLLKDSPVAKYLKRKKFFTFLYVVVVHALIFFTVKEVQGKWKNLRDYFRNELKKIPIPRSGDASDIISKSHWPYFKNLMFLKDQILPRQSQSNLPENDSSESVLEETRSQSRPESQLSDEEVDNETEIPDQFYAETPSSSATEEPRTILKGRTRKRQNQIDALLAIEKNKMEFLINKQATKLTESVPADEDKLFFESLLPHVKKIEDCDKLKFRNEVQDLVQRYAYKPPTSQTLQAINYEYNNSPMFHGNNY